MPDRQDILEKSVTQGDYNESGGVLFFAVHSWPLGSEMVLRPSLEGLGIKEIDYQLAATLDHEPIWAGAIAIAISKISSKSWKVDSDIPLRTKRAQELLLGADAGKGWVCFLSKLLQDFLLCNNGAFIEVVRATKSAASQIIGLVPLDSMRCVRTGDPEQPVIYQDLKGAFHGLKAHEVIELVDMPSTRASQFGMGKSAAYRAYTSIYKMAAIDSYVSEKVSGRRPLAVHLINGLNDLQLRSVLSTAQSESDARGAIAYMGAIMATIPGDTTPTVATVPLAEFPDNFNRRDELDISILSYAANLGLDVQDIQPLTGRALGTGAQSEVLDEKAKGRSLASFCQSLTHALNMWVLSDGCTFGFEENDLRDKQKRAEVNSKTEAYIGDAVKAGILTTQQGLQVMVDEDIIDKAYLPVDETPDTTLSDDEKTEEEATENQPEAASNDQEQAAIQAAVANTESKSFEYAEILAGQQAAALRLARKVRRNA